MSIILTVMLVLSCIPMSAISASALADLGVTIDTGAWVTLKDTNNDGYYEIGNTDELYAFSAIVNGGNTSINGILTNNIVINTNLISSSGGLNSGNFRRWTPIGTYSRPYSGHFKGNNKTISGLYADNDYETGLFGYSRNLIENVGVIDSYIRGIENIGAIVGYNEGTIKNCYKTGAVRGDENVGGITGYNKGRVKNCYNSGNVDSNPNINCHYIVGSNNGTITNCYYDISRSGELSGTTYKTSSQFASGDVAYLLGDAFGQTLRSDELPVLGGAKVYCGYTDCALSEKTYSNSPIETPEHNHVLGDIDLDGIVSIRDVSTLSKYLAECVELTDCQLSIADADGDGYININDATHIQKMIAELV